MGKRTSHDRLSELRLERPRYESYTSPPAGGVVTFWVILVASVVTAVALTAVLSSCQGDSVRLRPAEPQKVTPIPAAASGEPVATVTAHPRPVRTAPTITAHPRPLKPTPTVVAPAR